MEESSDAIVETREELMVAPWGGNPSLRIGHFVKPTLKSITNPSCDLLPSSLFSETPMSEPQNLPLEVAFKGWLYPQEGYKTWEERLHSKYENQWKKAGIYQAIKASTYQIPRNQDIILGLAQKWYPETNTFIFPWGEVTITLEDIMVCGGYSVIGAPVFSTLESQESREKETKLESVRRMLNKTKSKKPSHSQWMDHFKEKDGELEHEAFLSLWLSRYVFPGSPFATISKKVFSIAIQLARGTRIALAPAVLASIYRDLGLLNEIINGAIKQGLVKNSDDDGDGSTKTIWAPFQLVQIWALERFPTLGQEPNTIEQNEPISAKWHRVKIHKNDNMYSELSFAGNSFEWRPYRNLGPPLKFYGEKGEWVSLDCNSKEELQLFSYCLKTSELVTVDRGIQHYLPHRVAMQFGLDQDVPSRVSCCKNSSLVAWNNYRKPVIGTKLYVPSRTHKPNVTTRYLGWWKRSKLGFGDPSKDSKNLNITWSPKTSPGSPSGGMETENPSHPPGFLPKCDRDQQGDGKLKLKDQYLRFHGDHRSFGNEVAENDEKMSSLRNSAAETADVVMKAAGNPAGEQLVRGSKRTKELIELIDLNISELEARIFDLENMVGKTKAAKIGCQSDED